MIENRFFDRGGKRTGVPNAGGATVTDEIKTKGIEVRLKAGSIQVIGDDTGSGGEGGFDGGVDREPALDRFFGKESSGQHDRWVRGVGARSDGGDHHRSVSERGGFWILDFGFRIFG